MNWEKIEKAIETIKSGVCNRCDLSEGVIVYKCGTIIRIDIKNIFKEAK